MYLYITQTYDVLKYISTALHFIEHSHPILIYVVSHFSLMDVHVHTHTHTHTNTNSKLLKVLVESMNLGVKLPW